MKKKGIAEPLAAYTMAYSYDPLEEATKTAQSILDSSGIKAIDIVTEEIADETDVWMTRIFFINKASGNAAELNVKLTEELVRKHLQLPEDVVVMFMTAENKNVCRLK